MTRTIERPVSRSVATADTGEITGCSVVRPDRQSEGIGSAPLGLRGVPARLEADDSRDRDRYPRHGYVYRPVVRLSGRPAMRSMWRTPMP